MKVWWLAGGIAVLAAAAVTAVVVTHGDKPAPVAVSTSKVGRGPVSSTVSASGTIQAQATRTLGFSGSGTLTELNVKAGDVVAPGAVLAKIDDTDAQAAVDQASESVSNAQDALDKAEDAHDAALATPTANPTTAAPNPSSSRAGGSQTGQNAGQGQNVQQNTQQNSQNTAQNRANQIQQTSDNLMSAQQRLNNAKLSLTQASTKLAGTVITAPVGGKILAVSGSVGSQAGAGVVTLAGTGDAVVKAQFTEAEVAALKVGQAATITLPDNAADKYTGKVLQIDPAGTLTNRLVRYAALISFDKVPDTLLYGQSATVAVVTASVDDVLNVPATAVHDGYVTVRINGKDERKKVETGLRGDVNTEIKSGLAQGDEILTAGQ
ncbi:HlyD family efflux transporter periplasmic adaptor subunit [Dactylosporangium vinaceum]|uniref:Efflux RND transporter periplasmic adaptor subunit n=1 Tax=Dactylosporangium vinaceum TaxID=53362 RepID=A0ABV5MPE6_9ACTN|nr:HlyD family efflux transporter periplasmic adaptor subunit [Dactylosporangium vinaceum]UAB96774.1 HlyD family efflux transporter periplasmic adaptor subunit [Dactylosporangium vinaceum]